MDLIELKVRRVLQRWGRGAWLWWEPAHGVRGECVRR
jgi:hypothetical protein